MFSDVQKSHSQMFLILLPVVNTDHLEAKFLKLNPPKIVIKALPSFLAQILLVRKTRLSFLNALGIEFSG